MRKLLITLLLAVGLLCTAFAQDVTFTIMKTDGSTESFTIDENTRFYYSDTQLFIYGTNLGTQTYNLSSLRKAYFTVLDDVEEVDNQQLTIYPNPANDVLKIINTSDNQIVTIYSVDGKIIKKVNVSGEAEINISELQAGLYLISIGNEFSKFIKI